MVLMLSTDAVLYLPISIGMLEAVLDDNTPFEEALAKLPVPQISCLVFIQRLHTNAGKQLPTPGRMLSDTISVALKHVKREGEKAFVSAASRILDRNKIQAGCELLPELKILLLPDADVAFRSYLLPDGSWNPSFCGHYRAQIARTLQEVTLPQGRRILTHEQTKIYLEIKGHTDDHLHVQGYAGTGKSFLIKSILQLMQEKNARTLVLAEHERQLDALLIGTHGNEGMYPRTFGALVREMIPRDLTGPATRRMHTDYSPEPTPHEHLVRHLGIHESGLFSPNDIVKMVRETVNAFCSSDDEELGKQHIPPEYILIDPTTRQVVLHHATELWKAILVPPTRDFDPRVRDHHRLKWAALRGLKIPATYTHILIDECHDLARPMLEILNRSPQPAFSLGDDYQNLQGQPRRRSVSLRAREVTHSVRSGRGIEEVVAPIIRIHPCDTKPDFHGNPLTRTEVAYYDKAHVPDHPAVVLVSDVWGLFEWAQRIAQKQYFELLSDSHGLKVFVEDLIELHKHGTRARHRDLFRFASWGEVLQHYRGRRAVERVDDMLRNEYDNDDWLRTSAKFLRREATGYALGLIADVRNREFASVMLAPDIVDRAWDNRNVAREASALYVAVTRAQRRLIVPRRLRHWIEEISRN
jgi:hypothetical protein